MSEILEAGAFQLPALEKVIPADQGGLGVLAFEIVGRIEQVLSTGLALAAGERTETVEPARDRRGEPQFALAVGGDRAEQREQA